MLCKIEIGSPVWIPQIGSPDFAVSTSSSHIAPPLRSLPHRLELLWVILDWVTLVALSWVTLTHVHVARRELYYRIVLQYVTLLSSSNTLTPSNLVISCPGMRSEWPCPSPGSRGLFCHLAESSSVIVPQFAVDDVPKRMFSFSLRRGRIKSTPKSINLSVNNVSCNGFLNISILPQMPLIMHLCGFLVLWHHSSYCHREVSSYNRIRSYRVPF